MQLDIATRHGHLSEATRTKLETKAEKLSRYFDRLTSIEIIVDLEDTNLTKVDIKVSAEHKHDFVAHSQSEKLMSAVEAALQKIEHQLQKYKQRVQQKHRNPDARRQDVPEESDPALEADSA